MSEWCIHTVSSIDVRSRRSDSHVAGELDRETSDTLARRLLVFPLLQRRMRVRFTGELEPSCMTCRGVAGTSLYRLNNYSFSSSDGSRRSWRTNLGMMSMLWVTKWYILFCCWCFFLGGGGGDCYVIVLCVVQGVKCECWYGSKRPEPRFKTTRCFTDQVTPPVWRPLQVVSLSTARINFSKIHYFYCACANAFQVLGWRLILHDTCFFSRQLSLSNRFVLFFYSLRFATKCVWQFCCDNFWWSCSLSGIMT